MEYLRETKVRELFRIAPDGGPRAGKSAPLHRPHPAQAELVVLAS